MDAAVASALCLGVVSPASSGIGGGCFILIHTNTSDVFIDARELAPANSSADMFVDNPMNAQDGALAIAVPGELKGIMYFMAIAFDMILFQIFDCFISRCIDIRMLIFTCIHAHM